MQVERSWEELGGIGVPLGQESAEESSLRKRGDGTARAARRFRRSSAWGEER